MQSVNEYTNENSELYFNPGLMLNQLLTTGPWGLEADLPLVGN